MGKVLKFPSKKETPKLAEKFNRSLSPATEEQAKYRRSTFRVLKGGEEPSE